MHNRIAYKLIAGSIITTCTTPGVIALTFDDGPLDYTNDLLDLLDERNVKATFFVAGNNRGKGHIDDSSNPWPAVMRRMYSADHHIASHTWTHRNLNEVNSTIRRSEMIYNEMAFRNLFGWIPTYMRAPYLECNAGSGCLDEMSDLGYHVVDQNVDTKDYENDSPQLIQNSKNRYSARISSNSGSNQYIILAHDVHEQTVQNLTAYMIDTAQDRGYRLVTVGECLGDPRENWYRPASRGQDVTSTSESATPTQTTPPTVSVPTSTASPTGGLTISPNQRCGGNTGYTCQGSSFGSCCSWYGYWYVSSVDVQIRSEHDASRSSHSNVILAARVRATAEQAATQTLARALLPIVEISMTLPTAFVALRSKQLVKTTDPRLVALSTDTGKDDPGEAAYQIFLLTFTPYTAAIVLPIVERAARGTLASAAEWLDYPVNRIVSVRL
jgi:peptidoglycan/xylan/chitin deacetylase (PgdA/CDA1 family)